MVPTFDSRYVSADYDLLDADESDANSDYQFPEPDYSPFDAVAEFDGVAISGGSVTAYASQTSSIADYQILAAGDTSLDVAATEEGATAWGCAGSGTYLEFTLAQDTEFSLQVEATGNVYGSLWETTNFLFSEDLGFSHATTGTLPAGDYTFEVYSDECLELSDNDSQHTEGSYDVALVLDDGTCETAFDLADFSTPGDVLLVGDAAILPDGVLRLTTDAGDEVGAAWRPGKAHLAAGFDTTFRFRISDGDGADGFAFVIQNQGLGALGGGGSDLGYGGFSGIEKSLAVEFDTFACCGEFPDNHISVQTRGLEANSALDEDSLGHTVLANSLENGQVHTCRITYAPGQLEVYLDGVSTLSVAVDLEDIDGESILDANGCARLGFAGATGGAASNHDILSWSLGVQCASELDYADFSDTAGLTLLGNAAVHNSDTLRLTPESVGQKGAAWHNDHVRLADGFITRFTFQVESAGDPADGFAFVIQNEGLAALGGSGHGLGYGTNDVPGITRSVAVEFDTFPGMDISVQTRGSDPNDSDDQYSLGQSFPSSLADGQPHFCRIAYVPGTLEVFLDGSETPELSVALDLQDISGTSVLSATGCAFLGFTAATGGFFATHDILNWSLGPDCYDTPHPGDHDLDCDVDSDDVATFVACASGPTVAADPGCEDKDFDSDGDVDMIDFGVQQRCFSGEGIASDVSCAD